jgi:diguanylate cyclase (GGDEF)-like protein
MIYKIYFSIGLIGFALTAANEIIYETVDLSIAVPFYALCTFLLFLAFSEKSVTSKTSIIVISMSIVSSLVSLLIPNDFTRLLITSVYALVMYAYLFYIGIIKTHVYKNMGYAIMSSGFALVLLSSLVQIHYLVNMNDLNMTYSIARGSTSIGFILVGVGLLSSILITEQNHLRSLSLTDPLTGMNNRRGLDYLLGLVVPSIIRNGKSISAIAMDIDFFKKINDTYGHDGGDEVLKAFSKMLQTCPRASDLSSRLGGEEFVIILPDTPLEGALTVAEKIRQKVEELEIYHGNDTIKLTSSFGVASQYENIDTDSLLKNADKALYKAKEEGRNRVCHTDMP